MPLPETIRYSLTMYMSVRNCPVMEDVYLVKEKGFYTMTDIARFLKMNYSVVNSIYKKKTNKYGDAPCMPTIEIKNIA